MRQPAQSRYYEDDRYSKLLLHRPASRSAHSSIDGPLALIQVVAARQRIRIIISTYIQTGGTQYHISSLSSADMFSPASKWPRPVRIAQTGSPASPSVILFSGPAQRGFERVHDDTFPQNVQLLKDMARTKTNYEWSIGYRLDHTLAEFEAQESQATPKHPSTIPSTNGASVDPTHTKRPKRLSLAFPEIGNPTANGRTRKKAEPSSRNKKVHRNLHLLKNTLIAIGPIAKKPRGRSKKSLANDAASTAADAAASATPTEGSAPVETAPPATQTSIASLPAANGVADQMQAPTETPKRKAGRPKKSVAASPARTAPSQPEFPAAAEAESSLNSNAKRAVPNLTLLPSHRRPKKTTRATKASKARASAAAAAEPVAASQMAEAAASGAAPMQKFHGCHKGCQAAAAAATEDQVMEDATATQEREAVPSSSAPSIPVATQEEEVAAPPASGKRAAAKPRATKAAAAKDAKAAKTAEAATAAEDRSRCDPSASGKSAANLALRKLPLPRLRKQPPPLRAAASSAEDQATQGATSTQPDEAVPKTLPRCSRSSSRGDAAPAASDPNHEKENCSVWLGGSQAILDLLSMIRNKSRKRKQEKESTKVLHQWLSQQFGVPQHDLTASQDSVTTSKDSAFAASEDAPQTAGAAPVSTQESAKEQRRAKKGEAAAAAASAEKESQLPPPSGVEATPNTTTPAGQSPEKRSLPRLHEVLARKQRLPKSAAT
ncbi:uncharacterized protein UTRI_02320 [Ustilago trichophora]|uniref:Uncharacterized protein n=1 Tax=Ustilago trichophora TaxID=86804 RepID=A0A5C3E8X1_9BASI|nr:uncharacterized protein UTRI_02320 [Ustilago trichophora]